MEEIIKLIQKYGKKAFQEAVVAYYLDHVSRINRCIMDGHDLTEKPCHYCHNGQCILVGKTIPRREA